MRTPKAFLVQMLGTWLLSATVSAQAATRTMYSNSAYLLAYADPGSGAMLWQLLLSSGVLIGFYYGRAKKWFSSKLKTRSTEDHVDIRG